MSNRQQRRAAKKANRNRLPVNRTSNVANAGLPMTPFEMEPILMQEYNLPASSSFCNYVDVICSAYGDADPDSAEATKRLQDLMCQGFANVLEDQYGFESAFDKFFETIEDILGNSFLTGAPMAKMRQELRDGLKLVQEHLLDNEWYGTDFKAEYWISGFKTPGTVFLTRYRGKEKP